MEDLSLHAAQSKGSSSKIGEHLDLVFREQEMVLAGLFSLINCFENEIQTPVRQKTEMFRANVFEMDKNHIKSFKKMFSSYNSKKKDLNRLEIKIRKSRKNVPELQNKKEMKIREIEQSCKLLVEEERRQINDITKEEREMYEVIGTGLANVVQKELNIFGHNFDITRELLKLTNVLKASHKEFEEETDDEVSDFVDGFVRITPPSSPVTSKGSLMRSLSGSMLSLSSLVDEGFTKVKKKKQMNKNEIILSELSEMLLEEPYCKENEKFEELQETVTEKFNTCNEEIEELCTAEFNEVPQRFYLERENSFVSSPSVVRSTSFNQQARPLLQDNESHPFPPSNVGRSSSFSQPATVKSPRPRHNSVPGVETGFEKHIKYLDDQNDLIFTMVNEKMAVDQMLNC